MQVDIGDEPVYDLVVKNTTGKSLTSVKLYYLGPAGTSPQAEITPAGASIASNATYTWHDLAAGWYRWDWVTSNNKKGSQTYHVAGPVLTINVGTP